MGLAEQVRQRFEYIEGLLWLLMSKFGAIANFTMRGTTPGVAANESVELTPFLILQDDKSYTLEVDTIVSGIDSVAGRVSKGFIRQGGAATCRRAVARKTAGLTTLVFTGTQATNGDVATNPWTLTFVVAAAPDRIQMVFATGAGTTAQCRVSANVTVHEESFP